MITTPGRIGRTRPAKSTRAAVPAISNVPPPHNPEAEQAVLGGLMLAGRDGDVETVASALAGLGVGDFYVRGHAAIFSTIEALHREAKMPDLVVVCDWLRQQGRLDEAGGAAYLTGLLGATFSPVTLAEHIPLLKRDAMRRTLAELGGHLLHHSRNGADLEALMTFSGRVLDDVREGLEFVHSPYRERSCTDRISGAALAADETSPEVAWLPFLRQLGVVGRGLATLLSAHGKAGKTTLLLYAVRALLPALPGFRITWITEEPRALWRARVRRFPEMASPAFTLIFASGRPWPDVVARLAREETDLLVVDTVRAVCGITDENDQASVTAAIQPLVFLARRKGWALVLVHHLRKSAADVGLGHAGSHALVGLVDVAVELHRDPHSRTRRVCKTVSRFLETPAEWVVDLRGDEMQILGDPGLLAAAETVRRVHTVLDETPRSRDEVAALLEPQPSRGALHNALSVLVNEGKATLHGRGTKGNVYRWSARKHSFIHDLSSIRERMESEPEGTRA
ncbi:MAG: DnaB-like helicase N-terminal domain-containing protein [bacterium]|nr:DnaB-like helicase N-terminal domain-containing protein [bacterium]